MRHPLELSDGLPELDPLVGVRDRLVERSLSEPYHLGGDADAAFVENLNGDLER